MNQIQITLNTAQPRMIIQTNQNDLEILRKEIEKEINQLNIIDTIISRFDDSKFKVFYEFYKLIYNYIKFNINLVII